MDLTSFNRSLYQNYQHRNPIILGIFLGTFIIGCHKKSSSPTTPSPEQTLEQSQGETPNTQANSEDQEFKSLPDMIIAEVSLDDEGKPIPGSAEVRKLSGSFSIADGASAAKHWGDAQASDIPTDELETSTSSWSPLPQLANLWDQYRPSYQTTQGNCYSYGQRQSYDNGEKRYYVFSNPQVNTYNSGPTVPICGGYGGYQPYPNQQAPVPPQNPGPGYPQNPGAGYPQNPGPGYPQNPGAGYPQDPYDGQLRGLLERYGVRPLSDADYLNESEMMVALGERLFNDKLLSAKNDIACATCHVERKSTGDGYSLGPIGEVLGGRKRGPFTVDDLLPRHSPHLFNAGHNSYQSFFWDGRVERHNGFPSEIKTPAGNKLPAGLNSALAAQALFPLIAEKEMGCGMGPTAHSAEEPIMWQAIMDEVIGAPGYLQAFRLAYPGVDQYGIEHLANAIAAFESKRWRTVNSRFDQYLSGQPQALNPEEKQGAIYFYTKGNCAQCHSGPLLTDHGYHNIVIPQFGPGAGDGERGLLDWGRGRVTNRQQDRYRFKTPSLRNVTRTGPWGHNGAYNRLEDFVDHYRRPIESFEKWNLNQIIMPPGFQPNPSFLGAWHDPYSRRTLVETREINGVPLSPQEMGAILKFLNALSWER